MTVSTYYNKQSNNIIVEQPNMTVWFSYNTPIAVLDKKENKRYVSINSWGPTTGKHLNCIDGGSLDSKKQRVDNSVVKQKIEEIGSR
jgi:hypothetical protein